MKSRRRIEALKDSSACPYGEKAPSAPTSETGPGRGALIPCVLSVAWKVEVTEQENLARPEMGLIGSPREAVRGRFALQKKGFVLRKGSVLITGSPRPTPSTSPGPVLFFIKVP